MIAYDMFGVKQLACAVIREAVEDYTGREWNDKHERFKEKKVSDRRWRSATAFLHGKTRHAAYTSMLEFCCELAGVPVSIIQKGAFADDVHQRRERLEDYPV
jgi:hypothetical protein